MEELCSTYTNSNLDVETLLAIYHGTRKGRSQYVTPAFNGNLSNKSKAMFKILEADIVVMQETKIQRKDLRDDMVLVPGWDVYFSLPKHKKGKWNLL